METSVAALLLLTSAVVIGCLVVNYAVNVVEQTLNTDNIPQMDRLRDLQNSFLNQTSNFNYDYNQTATELPSLGEVVPPQ